MKLRATTNFLGLFLVFAALAAVAQETVEVISLRHRTAEQVIPVLRPLLAPGGALTGQYNQLIVRTTPQNLAQLRSLLDTIDQPARRLMISVRFDSAQASAGAFGQSSASGQADQRMQVLEGGQAYISTGEARIYGQAGTGFAVVPRLSGATVFLDIATQQDAFSRGGAIRGQQAVSTVSGRLGEWIELGGVDSASERNTGSRISSRSVWVKVEEIR